MPWKPGQSGNPSGRRTGTRVRLTQKLIEQICDDWAENGADVLRRAREQNLPAYLALVGKVIPNTIDLSLVDDRRAITDIPSGELLQIALDDDKPREIGATTVISGTQSEWFAIDHI